MMEAGAGAGTPALEFPLLEKEKGTNAMSDYHEEKTVIKHDDSNNQKATGEADSSETKKGISRRRFIRDAAIGAAAAGAAIALKGGKSVLAQSSESGQVTVDAIMLSYIASPLGSVASSTNTYTKNNATTVRLTAASNRSLSIGANASILGFSVGSTTYRQTNSTSVTDGITIRRSTSESFTTPPGGSTQNTVFIGMLAPEMQFDGDTVRQLFRFLRADNKFALTVSDLQNPSVLTAVGIKTATANSFLSQYVTDPALLVGPRFKLRSSIVLSAGVRNVYTFTKATGSGYTQSKTSTTSVEITRSFGFNFLIVNGTFSVGSRIEITHTAVQEYTADQIISCQTTLERTLLGVNKVYWDRVFKTFVIIDAGPPTSGTYAQGSVTDLYGSPVSNGLVRLVNGNAEYCAMTDSNGNYDIKGVDYIPSGTYEVICGNDSQYTSLGGSAYLSSDPYAAQDTTVSGELYNLN